MAGNAENAVAVAVAVAATQYVFFKMTARDLPDVPRLTAPERLSETISESDNLLQLDSKALDSLLQFERKIDLRSVEV